MRHEILLKTYGTFEDLSPEQQAKEIDKNTDINTSYDWWDCSETEFRSALAILGVSDVEIFFSISYSQGDGASFKGEFEIPKTKREWDSRAKKYLKLRPQDALHLVTYDHLKYLRGNDFDSVEIEQTGRYSHSCEMRCVDDKVLSMFTRIVDTFYRELVREYEYLTSNEAVRETLEQDHMEFLISEETLKEI